MITKVFCLIIILQEFIHSLGVDIYRSENRVNPNAAYDVVNNPLKPELRYLDSQKYTVTSYKYLEGMEPEGANNEVTPFGLQLLDIAALQAIYGINWEMRADNTIYSKMTAFASTRPNEAFIYTIWDGARKGEIGKYCTAPANYNGERRNAPRQTA